MKITVDIHGKKSIIDNYAVKQFSIESNFLCVKHTNTLEQALRFCLNDAQRRYVPRNGGSHRFIPRLRSESSGGTRRAPDGQAGHDTRQQELKNLQT